MTQQDYLEDISEIRNMMERSSRFVSLSGFSGILIGTYALIGAYIAYRTFYFSNEVIYHTLLRGELSQNLVKLIIIGSGVLLATIGTAAVLSYMKARKAGHPIWDSTVKRLLSNLAIPLVAGGIFVVILLMKRAIGLVAPATLIFYGLALVNASKYTLSDIRYLGICQIILGLISTYYIGYGLLFWAIGFGALHIIYGVIMYNKYER